MGCERFFGLSGYVSPPRRNMLGVRNYERIAMVSHMLQYLNVDPKWVVQEYTTEQSQNMEITAHR